MRVGILRNPPDMSGYVAELLKTWGLALGEMVCPESLPALTPGELPVLIVPAGSSEKSADLILEYVRRGGAALLMTPQSDLAQAAGLECRGEKETPLRLRLTAYPAAGLAGELLPIVGRAITYDARPDCHILGYLSHPGRYEGESVGMTARQVGKGWLVAFAFDLPLCVLMLRQGDPARAEYIPPGDGCARPSHLAADLGPNDTGWVPFADLLSRLLVDTVRRHMPAPLPLLSHLPGSAAGILLYSGDEDEAEISWIDEELDYLTAAGVRMNLYLIPIRTNSTPADVRRYARHHDLGPHPDLRPLDGAPVATRLADFERQIRLFGEMFGRRARTIRNHSTVWPGYMEPAEVMERLGVRMDTNYFSGTYKRDRESAPYASFGGALPVRFCRPDGRLLDVFQQHTHIGDDVMFGPAPHAYKYSAAMYETTLDRILDDIVTRFHTPYTVCIHPTNWVIFSGEQGKALVRQAAARRMPIWSIDQWSAFWDARDGWMVADLEWDGFQLQFSLAGGASHESLRLAVPIRHGVERLREMRLDGETIAWESVKRFREEVALAPIPAGKGSMVVRARYE